MAEYTSGTPSGGTPPLSSAGPGSISLPSRSKVHETANQFVTSYQKPLEMQLAQISQLAKTDPVAAQKQLIAAWTWFLDGAEKFSSGGQGNDRVVQQALNTPGLTNTVLGLWNETGGQGGFDGLHSSIASTSPNQGPRWERILGYGIDFLKGLKAPRPPQPGTTGPPNTTTPPPEAGQKNPDGTTVPGTQTQPTQRLPGGAQGPVNPDGGNGLGLPESVWKQLAPYLPFIGSTFANIYGAVTTSNAAKEAAAAQLAAAQQATELQRNIYNTNRADSMPWLNTGTRAVYRLSDLMGLQPGPRTMPNQQGIGPITLGQAGAPGTQPTPRIIDNAPTGGGGPMEGDRMQQGAPLDIQAMAARYRPAVRTV